MEFIYICVIFILHLWTLNEGSPVVLEAVEWKFSRRLYDYKSYASFTLERIELPPHTLNVNLTITAFANHDSCATRDVDIYYTQNGIPVVSRDKEAFPAETHTPNSVANITIATNKKKHERNLTSLYEGSLFVMAVMPDDDTRIRQKGLYKECVYKMNLYAAIKYCAEDSVPVITNTESTNYALMEGSKTLISFKVPVDTSSYDIEIHGCQSEACPLSVFLWDALSPNMWKDKKAICTFQNGSCSITKMSPRVSVFHYIGLDASTQNESVSISLTLHACTQHNDVSVKLGPLNGSQSTCVLELGRETPSYAYDGSSFKDRFVVTDIKTHKPKMISMNVSDEMWTVMRFLLITTDIGGTLDLNLFKSESKTNQKVEVTLCATFSRMVASMDCSGGAVMKTNSDSKEKKTHLMVPYPQAGVWYLSLRSRCWNGGHNQSSNATVECEESPLVNLTVEMSSCVENGCGDYGKCKMYFGANILYKACSCYGGWRGYGCNDGSKATGLLNQKVAVYLLTFSNLGFIPGICLALYRRFYLEAFVYTYNMFFSTFYHACDSSHFYKLCILSFEALSFADFFASLLSFAVTLLAMARIPVGLRSFLHMVAAMLIAVAEVYNQHGLVEQLLPIVGGVAIVVVTWIYEMYKRKSLFPSKRRYFKFIIPGLVLVVVALSLNLAVQTDENYKYVHSVWHILVSASILFLLPPRRGPKWNGSDQPLSIQSGDVTSSQQGLFLQDDHTVASFQNADEPDPPSVSETTSLNNNRARRGGRGIMLLDRNQNGRRQNYVL